jgi:purine nucleosidase
MTLLKPVTTLTAALLLALMATAPAARANAPAPDSPAIPDNPPPAAPVAVIFDTDMWSDIDDAMALAMLHTLEDRHEIRLVAVTVSTDEPWCAPYVDLIDTFYGHPEIPVGRVHDGLDTAAFRKLFPNLTWPATRYTERLSQATQGDGSLVYPHRLIDGQQAPEAVDLLRETLAAQSDGSVVVIGVGYSTNLARLLASGPDGHSPLTGRELIRRKVRLLSVMAGNYAPVTMDGKVLPAGTSEFNIQSDVPAARKVFSEWPTPIVASGFEIGFNLLYPAASIEHDFSYVAHHPIADTYRLFAAERSPAHPWPHDHPTFDLTAVLYAVRPDRRYFSVSNPGRITVLDDGGTRFEESAEGHHRYLILTPHQKARALEALVMLVSEPPRQH